ncbi:beta-propeller domain-containing protein [Desulfofalx alkaliphila]|uniref:beta-propeller domain-containing protein n=1 Tax=Desulfofalx alkaliphila TaxID=105483 RepID=UPI00054D3F01|nr:beta-propeller domain-containing protein [Desulfofalx alkaliphila]
MLKRNIFLILLVVLPVLAMGCQQQSQPVGGNQAGKLYTFQSRQELAQYVEDNIMMVQALGTIGFGRGMVARDVVTMDLASESAQELRADTKESAPAGSANDGAADYSTTNLQVDGVDEADIVKSDGRYLYLLSRGHVFIVEAYPADKARVLSQIKLDNGQSMWDGEQYGSGQNIFVKGNKLVVMGYNYKNNGMYARVYDISDRNNPVQQKEVISDGVYSDARMIGDHLYLVAVSPVYRTLPVTNKPQPVLPKITVNGSEKEIAPQQIYHFDQCDVGYDYTMILSFNINDAGNDISSKTYLTGTSQNIYVSENNIYLTNNPYMVPIPLMEDLLKDMSALLPEKVQVQISEIVNSNQRVAEKLAAAEDVLDNYLAGLSSAEIQQFEKAYGQLSMEWHNKLAQARDKTTVHKIAINKGNIKYLGSGQVPGRVLNQFSMDEHKGYFRIATTSGDTFSENNPSKNNIYVLDGSLKTVGKIEGLAPTERIYSARFMGDRAYLVTFREVDPFFVIDLKDPHNPKMLGELKITGYSSYMHPYDENCIIGIGKEMAEPAAPDAGAVRPLIFPPVNNNLDLGVKISLFDVSDPANPKEKAKYVVKNNGGYVETTAQWNHKAVLFNRDKNLLVLPISFYPPYKPYRPVDDQWHGVYVFDISEEGISLRGKIAHQDDRYYSSDIRSLYMDDVLYTTSEKMIKMNRLDNLKQINQLRLHK